MRIGIIGTGNMGKILTEAILDAKYASPSSMWVTNRTKAKALLLKDKYSNLKIGDSASEVAAYSDLVFICVKPLDVWSVLQDIKPYLTERKCIVSITSPINTGQLESIVCSSVVRAIPSITNRAFSGVSLITYGDNCQKEWKEKVQHLFSKISVPVEIEESVTRVASDIVSCGPAFFSYLIQRFTIAAAKETHIEEEIATKLASEMLIGLGELLRQGHFTLPSLQEKVCVKGGITGEGIKVLENELGNMFEHLFQATHAKFDEDLEKVQKQFSKD